MTVQDDGSTVVIDLHGLVVDEALRLAQGALREATRRGRQTVKLIHGSSTSSTLYRNRTIKHELETWLKDGALQRVITGHWAGEGYLLLSLPLQSHRDPERIRQADLLR